MMVRFNAKKLQTERKHRALTQAILADKAEISERYVRALEAQSHTNPSAALVFRLSKVLDLTMDDLMTYRQEEIK